MNKKLYSAESVGCGHPDKLADTISDIVLYQLLLKNKNAKCACETLITGDNNTLRIIIAGEIGGVKLRRVWPEIKEHITSYLDMLGYTDYVKNIKCLLHEQSRDIHATVMSTGETGAGDQGIVYGYACKDNIHMLPSPYVIASLLMLAVNMYAYGNKHIKFDSKCLITMEGDNLTECIVALQHTNDWNRKVVEEFIIDELHFINKNVFNNRLSISPKCLILNMSGPFILGGPVADSGVTGRKLMVDTYGSLVNHGGGAFSGKDASKVDRTGAYYARYLAKNILHTYKEYEEVEVKLTYKIGDPKATSIVVLTDGYYNSVISEIIYKMFNYTVDELINLFKLKDEPRLCLKVSNYGHFIGELPWEELNMWDSYIKNNKRGK